MRKPINIKQCIFYIHLICIVSIFLSCNAYCNLYFELSPDNKQQIVWECKKNLQNSNIYTRNCNIYALDANGNKEWIHQEADLPEPTVTWHDISLAEVRIPCGSPCNYSIFFDVHKGVSKPFEFVLAVNANKHVIARARSLSRELSPLPRLLSRFFQLQNRLIFVFSGVIESDYVRSIPVPTGGCPTFRVFHFCSFINQHSLG